MFSFTSRKPFVNAVVYRKKQENKGVIRVVNEVNGKIRKDLKSRKRKRIPAKTLSISPRKGRLSL